MKARRSIQLIAAFLLTVFSLNTVMGFACSLGLKMGYNSQHHKSEETTEAFVHTHEDGEKHVHQKKKQSGHEDKDHHFHNEHTTQAVAHIHKDGKVHSHNSNKTDHRHDKSHHQDEARNTEQSQQEKDNCCTDDVVNIQHIDKTLPASINIVHPVFFTSFLAVYYNVTVLPHTNIVRDVKPFVRNYHPPIPDIRIAIQSFQI